MESLFPAKVGRSFDDRTQAYLRDIVGSGPLTPDSRNKASHTNSFGFPVRVKVMFTLYCSLSVQ